MYALHEAGTAVGALPAPGPASPPPGQVDRRAVESTEHGTLETEDRREVVYTSGSAVLQLVRDSAESIAEIAASDDALEGQAVSSGAYLGDDAGKRLDVYA